MTVSTRTRWIVRGAVVGLTLVGLAVSGWWMMVMPGDTHTGPLPPLDARDTELSAHLAGHVEALAGKIGPRHVSQIKSLKAAERYIASTFVAQGHEPLAQGFFASGHDVANIEVTIPGADKADEIIVVGAHYDTHKGSPGASDNASGVAALLELGRMLSVGAPHARTIKLVAFVNEEMPFSRTDLMGSVVYARAARDRGDNIVEMFALETIGNYSDAPNSQIYDTPFTPFYPNKGNFISFIGDLGSRPQVARAVETFREEIDFPSEGLSAPYWLTGSYRSDHWAFWIAGYPGIMVTDTAPYRSPEYHRPDDTPEKLEYDHMARVVRGLHRVIVRYAAP